jgi:hypothetical protein
MARKQKVYQVTITKEVESAFNLLKLHRINVADVCRDAILRRSEMIRTDDLEEAIEKKLADAEYLTKMRKRQQEEEKYLEDIEEGMEERINLVIGIIENVYDQYGYLSKPMVERTCNYKKVEFKTVWNKLPVEWTHNAQPYEYDEVDGTKEHKEAVGLDFSKIAPTKSKDKLWRVGTDKEG